RSLGVDRLRYRHDPHSCSCYPRLSGVLDAVGVEVRPDGVVDLCRAARVDRGHGGAVFVGDDGTVGDGSLHDRGVLDRFEDLVHRAFVGDGLPCAQVADVTVAGGDDEVSHGDVCQVDTPNVGHLDRERVGVAAWDLSAVGCLFDAD